jgi:hypothetical protein
MTRESAPAPMMRGGRRSGHRTSALRASAGRHFNSSVRQHLDLPSLLIVSSAHARTVCAITGMTMRVCRRRIATAATIRAVTEPTKTPTRGPA